MRKGVTVSPGVETTIEVTDVRRVRLSQPWGTCTAKQYLVPSERDQRHHRYTSESCFEICKQEQVSCLKYTIRVHGVSKRIRDIFSCNLIKYCPIFSERELTFTFAICYRPSVRLSVVCL